MEQSACCLETELASVLVSSVTFCQTVSGPYCLRPQLEHHVPVPRRTWTGVCLNGAGAWKPARTWAWLCFLIWLPILSGVQSPGRSTQPPRSSAPARKSTAVPSRAKRPRGRTTVAAASLTEARGSFSTSSRLGAPLRAACVVAMSALASLTPSTHVMIHMAVESERGVNV